MFDTKAIAKRLRDGRRHKRRVTQEAFAAELGIRQSAVSDLENGKKGSGIQDLHRLNQLAMSLEMELPYLVFGLGDDGLPRFQRFDELEMIAIRRITKAHREHLQRFCDEVHWKERLTSAMAFETYRFYRLAIQEGTIEKRLGLVIHDDRIVATMKARALKLNDFVDSHVPEKPEGVDWLIRKRLNPFEVLAENSMALDEETYRLERDLREEELSMLDDEEILIVEAMYVDETVREHGLARMMLEAIAENDTASLWLSLLPQETLATTIEAVEPTIPATLGQMSLNASIAERLGFWIDEWREAVPVIDQAQNARLPCHTWAYRLSSRLAAITADDELAQELALTQMRLARCTAKLLEKNTKE